MALTLAVLLKGVLYGDLLAHNVLSIHVQDSVVTALEVAIADKTKAFTGAIIISCHLGYAQERTKSAESVVKDLLIHHGIDAADEELSTDVGRLLLVGASLVDTQGFSIQLDPVHDVGCVLGVSWCAKLDKAEALMCLGDAVAGHMDVMDGAHLQHDLVHHG